MKGNKIAPQGHSSQSEMSCSQGNIISMFPAPIQRLEPVSRLNCQRLCSPGSRSDWSDPRNYCAVDSHTAAIVPAFHKAPSASYVRDQYMGLTN